MGLSAFNLRAVDGDEPLRLMTYDPAHFHAALIQKQMQPDLSSEVDVYATPGPDLEAHLSRIQQFNARTNNPTHWQEIVHTNADPLALMLAEHPGNVVVVSGKNRGKIDALQKIVGAGLNVLADKPWIIEPEDFPKLVETLDTADRQKVIAYDAMTQRFEISCILPRELVNDPDLFGALQTGSADQPAVEMESIHFLFKEVAGMPVLRPAWYFDIHQQGEALADIGTHLVDLVQWTLYPGLAIDYRKDIKMHDASRWPTVITRQQFERVSGQKEFPDYLNGSIRDGSLDYFSNDSVTYQLRGVFVKLTVEWGFEPPVGSKDSEHAVFRGTKSTIEVRQGKDEGFLPVVYVIPARAEMKPQIELVLAAKVAALQARYPGLAVKSSGPGFALVIPDSLRIGHEAHFALLTRRFLDYVRDPKSLPAWEKPNLLAKYFVTTEGVKLARQNFAKAR